MVHGEGLLEKAPLDDTTTSLIPEIGAPQAVAMLKRVMAYFIELVKPTLFIQAMTAPASSRKLRKTAWLDGLRGWAALLVCWMHNLLWSHYMAIPIFENNYGWDNRYHFITIPGVRLFFTGGHFAVVVFYVISGYVLSVKSLSLLQAGHMEALGDSLASSLFRRWMRLYIPVFGTTFVYMVFWHVTGIKPSDPIAQSNLYDEMWWWYANVKGYSFIFKDGGVPWTDYNFHSWSVPVEMKGSLVIFTCLMAFSRATRKARWWCTAGLMLYFFAVVDGWYCTAFLGGMLVADFDLMSDKGTLPFPELWEKTAQHKKTLAWATFATAIWLGGCPVNAADINMMRANPGWYYMSFLVPKIIVDPKWAFLVPGAILLIIAIPKIPLIRGFFETRFVQYLGRISFALYLIHGPVIWLFADRLYAATGMTREFHFTHLPNWVNKFPLPYIGPLGMEPCFLVPQLLIFPFTFWLSEVATKLFDEPSVQFTSWLYKKTLGA